MGMCFNLYGLIFDEDNRGSNEIVAKELMKEDVRAEIKSHHMNSVRNGANISRSQ